MFRPHTTLIAALTFAAGAAAMAAPDPRPAAFSVAHRGASAYAPEHTMAAYRLALEQGADYIEQDLAITKDGVLVCSHDPSLERVTNVEELFPDRFTEVKAGDRTTKRWFIEDFTLAEIKRLDAGAWFDATFASPLASLPAHRSRGTGGAGASGFKGAQIVTFQEAIDLIKGKAGFFPELKTPGRVRAKGFDLEQAVADILKKNGLAGASMLKGRPAVHLQVFEEDSLRRLAVLLPEVPRSFLIGTPDLAAKWLSPEGLKGAKAFVTGVAPAKAILDRAPEIVARAHEAGLTVVPYTFQLRPKSNPYSDAPPEMRKMIEEIYKALPDTPAAVAADMKKFVEVYKVDGLFTDNPDLFPR